ncbi:MAG TPA: hypothetical protein VN428_16340 [Bryobacteraceae bacterium]|nr:hypothetical protein [Bryobacteraceae bacterium]
MKPKWIGALVFWAAFLAYMVAARAYDSRWFDGGLILAFACLYLGMGVVVIARSIRLRSFDAFWRGRGFPDWFARFAADEPAPKRGTRLDPML